MLFLERGAAMKSVPEEERRSVDDRRRGQDRRQCSVPAYGGEERRIGEDRRLLEERRVMIQADRYFSHR
jgi:hypothetical protein